MRLFNLESGYQRDGQGKVVWVRPGLSRCHGGCFLFEFGPFYFTILRGECK